MISSGPAGFTRWPSSPAASRRVAPTRSSSGWRMEHVAARFLPLSMKSRGSSLSFLVPAYIRSPVKPMAGQMLVVAGKP